MTAGPLHPDNLTNGRDRDVTRGHGTRALGPSDTSDSASDIVGGPGLAGEIDGFGIDTQPGSDLEEGLAGNTAGPDVGDANLDSDSDSGGTGEAASIPRDMVAADGADIDTDHVERIAPEPGDDEGADEAKPARH